MRREDGIKRIFRVVGLFVLGIFLSFVYVLFDHSAFVADGSQWTSMSWPEQVWAVVTAFGVGVLVYFALYVVTILVRRRRKIRMWVCTKWKKLAKWVVLIMGAKALAEVRARNAEVANIFIGYPKNARTKAGAHRFVLYDYSFVMRDVAVTAPKDQVLVKDRIVLERGSAEFSGQIQNEGNKKGIDFTISWTDHEGYPRWNFVHVPPPASPNGIPAGAGLVKYGDLSTSLNMTDKSLTVKWSNGKVVGRLVPASGGAWDVQYGDRVGLVQPEFVVSKELGRAGTPEEGVEMLKLLDLKSSARH